jgi:hypothetical protein
MITELHEKQKKLKKEKEDQLIRFHELEMLEKIRFDELDKKFRDLLRKANDYQVNEDLRDNEIIIKQLKINSNIKEKEDMEM